MTDPYMIVIGLEVHVQLATESKLFCRCSTAFGAPPNTQTCPVCIGMPGSLPVMNRRAFELSMQTAVALDCRIAPTTKWDRKNYYYPDLPKGYQISQYDLPFSSHGHLDISDPKGRFEPRRVGIERAHLEEDAGKSLHDEQHGEADSRIDLNRAGTPLLEIVTKPDMRSPLEAKTFLTELKLLLTYLGVSDCNMQEGSLRVDANINLHVPEDGRAGGVSGATPQSAVIGTAATAAGTIATPIVEIKNMNSFRAVERALEYEAKRQWEVWQETGQRLGDAPKQTRGWDDAAGVTHGQRHKEDSSDYRYFPDPDLAPITVAPEVVKKIRRGQGERPAALRSRLEQSYGITPYDSDVLVSQGRDLVQYYLAAADACGDGKLASNWLQQDVLRSLNERGGTIGDFPVGPTALADLLSRVKRNELDTNRARQVFQKMLTEGITAAAAVEALGIKQVDESELIALCRELLAANPKVAEDIRGGNDKAAGALVGQAKKRNPNANPGRVRELCVELAKEKM
ncbi:MAG: Asp-tRNA(Asn)/Glu-tRNA(Gln) amidotransferase subunit GatB [Planctomycetia bacterium]|nr:Asp-tRNA(Asn)/Glu-tRNA(Gln) amidotransferase subunit GatB [Planctomycetia bacterium]